MPASDFARDWGSNRAPAQAYASRNQSSVQAFCTDGLARWASSDSPWIRVILRINNNNVHSDTNKPDRINPHTGPGTTILCLLPGCDPGPHPPPYPSKQLVLLWRVVTGRRQTSTEIPLLSPVVPYLGSVPTVFHHTPSAAVVFGLVQKEPSAAFAVAVPHEGELAAIAKQFRSGTGHWPERQVEI